MTEGDHISAQLIALHFIVQALVSTHPDPARLREEVDQLFGQFQANGLASGDVSPAGLSEMRRRIAELFLHAST